MKAGEHNAHDWRYLYMNPKPRQLAKALVRVIDEEKEGE